MRDGSWFEHDGRGSGSGSGYISLAAFVATIPAANWMINNIGTHCIPHGPCLISVAGISAPSGVIIVGIALVLRDIVQHSLGISWTVGAIILGAVFSAMIAAPELAIASAAAFFFSEFADLLIYTPLYRRRLVFAVIASSIVGAVADSIIFLWLAFESLDYLFGQIMGKMLGIIIAMPAILWFRNRSKSKRTT